MEVKKFLENHVLIFDGAMGTYYANTSSQKCELANIEDPKSIINIHREYIESGCKAIKTNTFAANTVSLNCDFLTIEKIIISACNLAKEAIDKKDIFLFADIGPIASFETSVQEEYKKIIDVFLSQGIQNFIFETFSHAEHLDELAKYIKTKKTDSFVLMEFAVSPEGFTRMGFSGKKLLESLSENSDIDAVGFNCFSGVQHLFEYIHQFDLKNKLVSIMPNAGYPTIVDNRTFFQNHPDYFSAKMKEIAQLGVKILGGCCGTTPVYIQKTVENLKSFSIHDIHYQKISETPHILPFQKENLLIDKINAGKKIIAVELDPPLDTEITFFMDGAKILKHLGVDAITIADCPIARARVDSSLLACKLKRELDITPIPHMTCRDRNINATKALLLGLNIEGVNNILVVTGDPVPSAERDEIKTIFSFNSTLLANYISTLNETSFQNPFQICGALNVNSRNFDLQLQRAQKKVENGISMFLTQPILTEQAFQNLKKAKTILPAKILGGIIPVVSHRNACFMNNEISGITVSQEIIDQYEGISKEDASKLAIQISVDIARKISDYVDGYYLITPFKRIDIIQQIIYQINHQKT